MKLFVGSTVSLRPPALAYAGRIQKLTADNIKINALKRSRGARP